MALVPQDLKPAALTNLVIWSGEFSPPVWGL
jgi:hypothetical protein